MNAVVLLTAMTATSGLFGGHRQARTASCNSGACNRSAAVSYAPAPTTCRTGQCPKTYATAAPAAYASAPVAYTSYYAAPAAAACATGTCPRR